MPKKVYDIKPPKLEKKIESGVKKYLRESVLQNSRRQNRRGNGRQEKQRRPVWVSFAIAGGVVSLMLAVYLFLKLPRANVDIWPEVEILNFQQTVIADQSVGLTDISDGVIPARRFEITKTLSEDFPATGNASDKGRASGVITIFNKFDPPQSVTFRAGTHFLSDSGKLFRAEERIIIPAAQKSGGKITPGSVRVSVQAVEGGDSYNIPASNFSIPGLKGTAFYYSVYASSDTAMSGGFSGDIKKITENDIQSAQDALAEKLVSQAMDEIQNQASSDYAILDSAVSSEIMGEGADKKPGTVADNFKYEATVKLSALAFKKTDLREYVKKYVISQMPDGKTLLDSSLKTDYSVLEIADSGDSMTLDVGFSSGIYKNIDKNFISLSLAGKNANQINDTVAGVLGDELSETKVSFWPFWVSKAPKNQKAINVNLKFD